MIDYIINNPKIVLDVVAYAIAITSVIVKLTPSVEDDKIWSNKQYPQWLKILKLISLYKRK